MAIKIIATDLDGTLMMPDHLTVSERTKNALFRAHINGVKIAISTGRTLSLVENVIEQIPFVDFVMYSDGASVYDVQNKKRIFTDHISPDRVAKILDFLNDFPIYYNVYLDGKLYTQSGKERHYIYTGLPEKFVKAFYDNTKVCQNLKEEIRGKSAELVVAFSIAGEDEEKIYSYLSNKDLRLHVTSAMKSEIEVTTDTATKGLSLKFLCDRLGIDRDEVMAIGDSGNDSTMLEFAGCSVAMENGDEACKSKADYITSSNKDDGVAIAIEKFVL